MDARDFARGRLEAMHVHLPDLYTLQFASKWTPGPLRLHWHCKGVVVTGHTRRPRRRRTSSLQYCSNPNPLRQAGRRSSGTGPEPFITNTLKRSVLFCKNLYLLDNINGPSRALRTWIYQCNSMRSTRLFKHLPDVLTETETEYATACIVILACPQPSLSSNSLNLRDGTESLPMGRYLISQSRPYWFTDVRRTSYLRVVISYNIYRTFAIAITTASRTLAVRLCGAPSHSRLGDVGISKDHICHLESELLARDKEIEETQQRPHHSWFISSTNGFCQAGY
ncbi:hypothetical protein EV421DRAFT_2000689 [Armillaria borealis]|uniref:Uncharacterized protein n=1 Tax=Armillaria borealis TaxID=47425 RepID=A0AA39MG62_9AGAR|nr:hypothetical protein EV421DRAFT_2000689 [Armillaria borealis]